MLAHQWRAKCVSVRRYHAPRRNEQPHLGEATGALERLRHDADHVRLRPIPHAGIRVPAVHAADDSQRAEQLWENLEAIWSRAWSANYAVLEFMQDTGLTRFAPVKPQHWVVASFEHHTSPHGLPRPHIHNLVLTSLTTGANAR